MERNDTFLAPRGLTDGDVVIEFRQNRSNQKSGNCMPLKFIPTGLTMCTTLNLNLKKVEHYVRSAGAACKTE